VRKSRDSPISSIDLNPSSQDLYQLPPGTEITLWARDQRQARAPGALRGCSEMAPRPPAQARLRSCTARTTWWAPSASVQSWLSGAFWLYALWFTCLES